MRRRKLLADLLGVTWVDEFAFMGRNSSSRDLVVVGNGGNTGEMRCEEDGPNLGVGEIIGPDGQVQATAEDMKITLPPELVLDLERFDGLPQRLRWTLHETIIVWRATPFATYLSQFQDDPVGRMHATFEALVLLHNEELGEEREFGAIHRLRYGYRLPHLAAHATIQRYGKRQ